MMSRIYQQYMYSYPHKTAYQPVSRELVTAHLAALAGESCGLYIHLPFCASKCGFCNLFSVSGCAREAIDAYLEAIGRQLKQITATVNLRDLRVTSLTLGGGTPSLLSVSQLSRLIDLVEQECNITPAEASGIPAIIELAPSQTNPQIIEFLLQRGFRRISIGVQSFRQEELTALQRHHSPTAIHRALELIREAGFPGFNIDLIYGIPGQTRSSLLASLQAALSYQPNEIFLYPLYLRPQTPLAGRPIDEEAMLQLYSQARDFLLAQGFEQLSMRRFCRQAEVEVSDCGFENVIALGCGGRSYLGNLHVSEAFAVEPQDCRKILDRFLAKEDYFDGLYGYLLNTEEQRRRYLLKNLLHRQGVDCLAYRELFASDPESDFPLLVSLQEEKLVSRKNQRLCLTNAGMARSDQIGPLFISPQVAARSAEFYAI